MNKSYYGIALDIKSVQSQVTFPVKQGDTSRGIKIILTDGGKAYAIERNCSATFKGEKSDGTEIMNICTIDNNRIVYDITEQTVASPGIVDCEVSLFDPNGNLITTPRFTLIVDSRVGSDEYESTDEYNALEDYLSTVEANELERQANEEARKNALATVIDENSTHEQYASAQATYEYGQKVKTELIESVDSELNEESTNPVTNKAITLFLDEALGNVGEELEELKEEVRLKVSTFDRTQYGDLEAKKEDNEAIPSVPAMFGALAELREEIGEQDAELKNSITALSESASDVKTELEQEITDVKSTVSDLQTDVTALGADKQDISGRLITYNEDTSLNATDEQYYTAKAINYLYQEIIGGEIDEKAKLADMLDEYTDSPKAFNYYSAPAVNSAIENAKIPHLDSVNVWELEAGVYFVDNVVCYATPDPPVNPNCVYLQGEKGFLIVCIDGNTECRYFYLFADGNIYFGESEDMVLKADGSITSVVATISTEITSDNPDELATTGAVYNLVEATKLALQGEMETFKNEIKTEIEENGGGTSATYDEESGVITFSGSTIDDNGIVSL